MVDGKLISKTLLPGTRRALLLLNRAYREKLIPPDFAVLTANQAIGMLQTNKAGMYYGPPESAWPDVEALRRTVPEADMLPLVSIDGVTFRDPGFFGMYAIPKTVSEAKLHQILAFMDYGASEEGSLLGNYGLRNVHFKEADGMKVTTEQAKKDAVSAQTFGQIFQSYDKYFRAYRTGMDKAVFLRNKSIIDERARISIPDYAKGLYSETNEKRGAAFTKTIIDMKIKVIMGREPISSWDSLVEQLKNDPEFAAIDREMNEAYLIRTGEQR
jgi:putative aldouronate transport system substrate-binding protein